MTTNAIEPTAVERLEIRREVEIAAPIEIAFEAVLEAAMPQATGKRRRGGEKCQNPWPCPPNWRG